MDGKKLIKKLCELLRKENIRVYDSNIIMKLAELSQFELEELVNGRK